MILLSPNVQGGLRVRIGKKTKLNLKIVASVIQMLLEDSFKGKYLDPWEEDNMRNMRYQLHSDDQVSTFSREQLKRFFASSQEWSA